jgi:hypothetical protein
MHWKAGYGKAGEQGHRMNGTLYPLLLYRAFYATPMKTLKIMKVGQMPQMAW